MTYAPETLLELRAFLMPRTGLSPANLGIVGDTAHQQRGTSYHLGADKLAAGAYSAKTARDRAGLSNAASALDIGRHDDLRRLSRDLVETCRNNYPGTIDIREVIYSPDGKQVLRWDRERGASSLPRLGEADDSHLWHTHVSWYRDSEKRDKVDVFRSLYGRDTAGGDMAGVKATPIGTTVGGIFRCETTTGTYPADGSPRGSLGAGGVRWAIGPYGLDGLNGLRTYAMTEDGKLAYVPAAAGVFTPSPRPGDDAGSPHTVKLIVDGAVEYEGVLL